MRSESIVQTLRLHSACVLYGSTVTNESFIVILQGKGACSHMVPVLAIVEEPPQIGDNNTRGDNRSHVENGGDENNLVQVQDNNANGSVNPAQPKDDEWPFDVIANEIIPTAQATPCDEICRESPGMLHQPIAMVKTPGK